MGGKTFSFEWKTFSMAGKTFSFEWKTFSMAGILFLGVARSK
ncbi:MAG: hypothetical protein WCL06_00955 [Bacteroidota bacterium]